MAEKLEKGELDDKKVSIEVKSSNITVFEFGGVSGMEDIDISVRDMMGNMFPGMKKENFDIQVQKGVLTIKGERKNENEEKGKNLLCNFLP